MLAGLAAQDPYAEVVQAPAFTAEPYGLGVNKDDVDFVRFVNGVLEEMRADGRWTRSYNTWLRRRPRHGARLPPPPCTGGRRDRRDDERHGTHRRPAGSGRPLVAEDALRYLEALGTWRDQRKAELDLLDEAALGGARTQAAYTGDLLLSMALWKAVADRHDLLVATWDSGRVGPTELERLSTLVWGRLDAIPRTPSRRRSSRGSVRRAGRPGRLAARGVPALRRAGGLAAGPARPRRRPRPTSTARLRAAAGLGRAGARPRRPRARARSRDAARRRCSTGSTRASLTSLARAKRGADVGGLLGPLEHDAARAERDLIVGASNRRADAHDEARARALRAELEARGAALRDLAARCVAEVAPAPRLAVPDVAALGPVPTEPAAVDAYLVAARRGRPGHDDGPGRLRRRRWPSATSCAARLGAYAAKARPCESPRALTAQAASGPRRAGAARRRGPGAPRPADLVRARALVAAYQAYLTAPGAAGAHGRDPRTRGTP